jgi:two-component system OmpR family response regulator
MPSTAQSETAASKAILLVEDEVLLCWVLDEALRESGYTVHTAATGNEGVAALESGRKFDFLVTNIRLADGPDGWALSRRAREINPAIEVLYVSGDSAALHGAEGVAGSTMLAKPFEPDCLHRTIAEMLGN